MPKKPDFQPAAYVYCGYLEVIPLSMGSSFSQLNESQEVQIKNRNSYKDAYGGSSSSFTGRYKAGKFVDKSTGGLGYKQEAHYTSTDKHVDKQLGFTTEYQTQVKFKKSVYPNKTQVKKFASPNKTQVKFKKSASPNKTKTPAKCNKSASPNKTQSKCNKCACASPNKKTQLKAKKSASPYKSVTKSYSKRIDYY